MKFTIFTVLGLIAVQALSTAKLRGDRDFCVPSFTPRAPKQQSIFMNNNANANGNAMAINAGFCGDANAFSQANAGNYNMISQSSGSY